MDVILQKAAEREAAFCPLKPLTEEENEFLYETADLMMQYPTIPCNDCKYCMPCPYGLDIPAILTHYNKCVNEGNVPECAQAENYKKARRAFLVGYDRSVPKLRQANHCIGCGQCSPHCPQSIDIPHELARIDRFVEHLKQAPSKAPQKHRKPPQKGIASSPSKGIAIYPKNAGGLNGRPHFSFLVIEASASMISKFSFLSSKL